MNVENKLEDVHSDDASSVLTTETFHWPLHYLNPFVRCLLIHTLMDFIDFYDEILF